MRPNVVCMTCWPPTSVQGNPTSTQPNCHSGALLQEGGAPGRVFSSRVSPHGRCMVMTGHGGTGDLAGAVMTIILGMLLTWLTLVLLLLLLRSLCLPVCLVQLPAHQGRHPPRCA
jgi:hypothetical protein